jgi:hypothetical protein
LKVLLHDGHVHDMLEEIDFKDAIEAEASVEEKSGDAVLGRGRDFIGRGMDLADALESWNGIASQAVVKSLNSVKLSRRNGWGKESLSARKGGSLDVENSFRLNGDGEKSKSVAAKSNSSGSGKGFDAASGGENVMRCE